MRRPRRPGRFLATALLLSGAVLPVHVYAQSAPSRPAAVPGVAAGAVIPAEYVAATTAPQLPAGYPDFRTGREFALTGTGAALLLLGYFVPTTVRQVPSQGLGPSGVGWSIDRNVIGGPNVGAVSASDWTRNAAMAVPLALAWIGNGEGNRLRGFTRRAALYTESLFLSQGTTFFTKTVLGRARPYAYLPEAERPAAETRFDVSRDRTFRGFPSGHASAAWNGSAIAMTEHLLTRPQASGLERGLVGFVTGALAGATSALRVEGDQHFPSDVLFGAVLGIGSGVAMPLVHRGSQPMPPSGAWWEMAGGAALGTLVSVLVVAVN